MIGIYVVYTMWIIIYYYQKWEDNNRDVDDKVSTDKKSDSNKPSIIIP